MFTHAMFMTIGIDMQWALGLKSLPRATGTPSASMKVSQGKHKR
jgi:hypothetical protein